MLYRQKTSLALDKTKHTSLTSVLFYRTFHFKDTSFICCPIFNTIDVVRVDPSHQTRNANDAGPYHLRLRTPMPPSVLLTNLKVGMLNSAYFQIRSSIVKFEFYSHFGYSGWWRTQLVAT